MQKKLLFVLNDSTQARHFFSLFKELVRRGWDVNLRVYYFGEKELKLPTYLRHIPQLKIAPLKIRSDIWGEYARAFRGTRNYFLYYHPKFPSESVFRERAWGWCDPFLRRWMPRDGVAPQWLGKALMAAENAIPADSEICKEIADGGYNVVLVSPYIFYQCTFHNDYVKAAHALGVPVGFPVFSWDNLTTKGNVQIVPDRIWVWNDIQKQELIELHGVPEPVVRVTGAYRFDDYRDLSPSKSKEEFCRELGLDPAEAIIAYLGSSPAVAPDESEFVDRWVESVRASADMRLSRANVVVRSHPRNVDAWKMLGSIVSRERLVFQEPVASDFWNTQNLYDLLSHADLAVGLNTSAMLEASIHGLPVHTVIEPSTKSGQEGAVHFWYLTEAGGGLLHLENNLNDHVTGLVRSLNDPVKPDSKAASFFKSFIDAENDDRTPTVRFADDIENLTAFQKRKRRRRLRDQVANEMLKAVLKFRLLPVDADPDYELAHRKTQPRASRSGIV